MEIYLDSPTTQIVEDRIVRFAGWIAADGKPKELYAKVNGLRCNHLYLSSRPDVEDSIGLPWGAGWRCFVESKAFLKDGHGPLVFELVMNGDVVFKSLHRCVLRRSRKSAQIVYFMHIPKTAGTSIRQSIEEKEGMVNMLSVYNDDPFLPQEILTNFSRGAVDDLDILYGHFRYGLHTHFNRPYTYAALVKNPIDHIRSYYLYSKFVLKHPAMTAFPTILSAFKSSSDVIFDNFLVRWFSGAEDDVKITVRHLEQAVRNYERDFAFVGFAEKYHEAHMCLEEHIGLNLEFRRENVTPKIDEAEIGNNQAIGEMVDQKCSFDVLLYRYIVDNPKGRFGHRPH